MGKRLLQIAVLAAFLLFFGLSFRRIDRLLQVKSPHGIDQMRYFYDQEEGAVEVLFMGSSHVHCSINTALLWEEYGIAGYDLSGAEQPLWMTWHWLREAFKSQTPQLVVLECYAPAAYRDEYHYKWISENIQGMRFSINKLQMLRVSAELPMWKYYFPGFTTWHNRYSALTDEDYDVLRKDPEERRTFKGYTPYFLTEPLERPDIQVAWSGDLAAKSELYLTKIMDLCEAEGVELFLIVSPYVLQSEEEARCFQRISELAMFRELEFYNFNTDEAVDVMGLDYGEDFNDYSHVNYRGGLKYGRYLGEVLRQRFTLPDHREGREKYDNDRYYSWDRHVDFIHEKALEAGFEIE